MEPTYSPKSTFSSSKTRLSCSRRGDWQWKSVLVSSRSRLHMYKVGVAGSLRPGVTSCSSCWELARRCTCSSGCPGVPGRGCGLMSASRTDFATRTGGPRWSCRSHSRTARSPHRSRCQIGSVRNRENEGIISTGTSI